MENWRRESARFAPRLRTFVHHGARRLAAGDFAGFDLVLTSYGTLARDQTLFSTVDFTVIVADEAQHIKNRQTQNAQAVKSVRARHRLVLTGTPLENRLLDLWSIVDFVQPGYLGTQDLVPDVVTMNNAHHTHWTATPDPRIPHVLAGWPEGRGPAEHRLDLGAMLVRNVTTDTRDDKPGEH